MNDVARQCPNCRQEVAVSDSSSDSRCPHCLAAIPQANRGDAADTRTLDSSGTGDPSSEAAKADRATMSWDGAAEKKGDTLIQSGSIGRFVIRRKLGEGSFGVVFEAYDPKLDRLVALKVAKLDRGDADKRTKRFVREAKAAANLRHPHIVPLYEFGQEGDQFYLASAFIAGQTLAADIDERTARKQPIDLRRAARIVGKMAEALAYAHREGIIHRDVKPDNTMLDGKDEPLIMDFGLAARREDEKLTQEGTMMGTAAYMAPEQSRGQSEAASDQYSLDVVLYELLTGQTPFSGPADVQIFHHVNTDPVSPRRLNPDVSRDLETICLKCLEKEPSKRYADCQALADDLRRYGEGEPVNARPVGLVERAWRWCKRKPGLATANAVVVIALIVVSSLLFLFKQSLDQEHIEREKAVNLAGEKQRLADENKKLAADEKDQRIEAQKLAKANKQLADDADERREQAEELALQLSFNSFYARSKEHSALGLVGAAQLLPKAAKLKNRHIFHSMRQHLSPWALDVQQNQLRGILSHESAVGKVALSADGKTALTRSQDKTARLWDTATGNPIGPPLQHQSKVHAVALSADGKTALTGNHDNTAQLWETATGKPIGPPLQHQGTRNRVNAVALSADGKTALTGSSDKTARLWEAATGNPIGPPLQHQGSVEAVALSADGKIALTGSQDFMARLWETTTGKPIGPPLQHQSLVFAVALSADGKIALTGSFDKTARLWETMTGTAIGPPLQHQDQVNTVALSADGKTALTGSYDNTARLWETGTGKPIGPPLQHQSWVYAVALSADGKTSLTGSADNTARLWVTGTGKAIGPSFQHQDWVKAVALSADGKTALTGSYDNTARLWETGTGKPIGPPLQHQSRVYAVALSADGKTALTGSFDKTARLWETGTGKPIGPPLQHKEEVNVVALSADGKIALTGSYYGSSQLWEVATGKPIGPPLLHQNPVSRVALSADGRTAIAGSRHDNTALLWEVATGKPIGPPLQHQSRVTAVALSADGKIALTRSFVPFDNTARLWEAGTGKPIGPPLQHQGRVTAVALSADGKAALTGCFDKTARLWETGTGKPIGPPLQHQDEVVAVAFSADGKTALTSSKDHSVRLWETATGKLIGSPLQHGATLTAVALSADGKTVLAGSSDKMARLWTFPRFADDSERIALLAQVMTGIEADDHGSARVLDAATWNQRRQRLQELGGSPEGVMPLEAAKKVKQVDPAPPAKEDPPKEKKNKPVDPVPPIKERPAEVTETPFKGLLTDKEPTQSYAVSMEAGRTYAVEMRSTSVHCYLRLFNPAGRLVAQDVNITPGILDARFVFTPREAGKYRIDAAAFQDQGRGDYTLVIRAVNGKAK